MICIMSDNKFLFHREHINMIIVSSITIGVYNYSISNLNGYKRVIEMLKGNFVGLLLASFPFVTIPSIILSYTLNHVHIEYNIK